MTRLAIFAVAGVFALFTGAAIAHPFTFETSSFDYSDSDVETGNIKLAMQGDGTLVVQLTKTSGSEVGTIDVEGQVAGHNDSLAERNYYRVHRAVAGHMLGAIDVDYRGRAFQRITITHDEQEFVTVKASYLARLAELGASMELEDRHANSTSYLVSTSQGPARLIFNRQGLDTRVTLTQ